jgi:hypothetical protein
MDGVSTRQGATEEPTRTGRLLRERCVPPRLCNALHSQRPRPCVRAGETGLGLSDPGAEPRPARRPRAEPHAAGPHAATVHLPLLAFLFLLHVVDEPGRSAGRRDPDRGPTARMGRLRPCRDRPDLHAVPTQGLCRRRGEQQPTCQEYHDDALQRSPFRSDPPSLPLRCGPIGSGRNPFEPYITLRSPVKATFGEIPHPPRGGAAPRTGDNGSSVRPGSLGVSPIARSPPSGVG